MNIIHDANGITRDPHQNNPANRTRRLIQNPGWYTQFERSRFPRLDEMICLAKGRNTEALPP
jgi:hypothetical protein